MARTGPDRPLRVLLSVRGPSPTTNPYVVLLVRSLPPGVEAGFLTWKRALLGRYDLLHLHWPEVMVRRGTVPARLLARARVAALALRLSLLGTPVVRTVHNVAAHEAGGLVERGLLAWLDRLTSGWVLLTPRTPVPGPGPRWVVPHGHYRDWYADRVVPPPVDGRLLCFGLLRPYKGVEQLLSAFAALPDPAATLRVVGHPTVEQVRDTVESACSADPRVRSRLEYVGDDVLATEVGEARLVVLPYLAMHNSGALLLALSLGRPVLVPRTPVTADLAAEVGPAWVRTYEGDLRPADLDRGLRAAARMDLATQRPDLTARDWPDLGRRHADLYRRLLADAAPAQRRLRGRPRRSRARRGAASAGP